MYRTKSAMKAFVRKLIFICSFTAIFDLSESVEVALEIRLGGRRLMRGIMRIGGGLQWLYDMTAPSEADIKLVVT